MALHVSGRGLPDEQPVDYWIVDGAISLEPVDGAETVFSDGWIIPGLVDAHCHVGIGPGGPVDVDEAVRQAETERRAGVLLIRDAGSPVDTRGIDDRADLPRIIRAGQHLARTKRYIPGLPIDVDDETQLPEAVAAQARRGDGWVKLVGDWIDRGIGDLAPLWSDEVLKSAIDAAHANGARVTAHVFGEDALPGLINAGIDCIEHGTGITDDIIELMLANGTALVPTLINIDNFPGIAESAAKYPTYAAHMRALHATCRSRIGAARGRRADLSAAPMPVAWWPTAASPTRSTRCPGWASAGPRRWVRPAGMPGAGWAHRCWSTALRPTWCVSPTTRAAAPRCWGVPTW